MRGSMLEVNRSVLQQMVYGRRPLLNLDEENTLYPVPGSQATTLTYRGLPLDLIEDLLAKSAAWKQVMPFLLPKEEMAGGRPITPLHGGHVGLLCTAGLLNGVFGHGADRHIARWRSVKHTSVFEEKDGDVTIIRKRERFSNELALATKTDELCFSMRPQRKERTMQNAHLRLGRLEYTRQSGKIQTTIQFQKRFMPMGRQGRPSS